MERVAFSPWFLGWVAFCSALCVAVATGAAWDESVAVRVLAGVLGLAVALGISFASLVLLARKGVEPAAVEAPASAVAETTTEDELRAHLEAQLAAGRLLRDEQPDTRVAEWIDATRQLLDGEAPGAARYFAALDIAAWPAHVGRLETILRDFLST